jgi:hypothetical protein
MWSFLLMESEKTFVQFVAFISKDANAYFTPAAISFFYSVCQLPLHWVHGSITTFGILFLMIKRTGRVIQNDYKVPS